MMQINKGHKKIWKTSNNNEGSTKFIQYLDY